MWWASGERQHVFVDLVVTQQGLKPAVGVEGVKEAKESRPGKELWSNRGGGLWVKVGPGSSNFPSRGPAEVRRVTERGLVILSMFLAPCTVIG